MEDVITFIGACNIPLINTVDETFYTTLQSAYHLGQQNPRSSFPDIYPKVSVTTVRSHFIGKYTETLATALLPFHGYACLAIDAGKERERKGEREERRERKGEREERKERKGEKKRESGNEREERREGGKERRRERVEMKEKGESGNEREEVRDCK
jgi:hypothetical protein